MPSSPPSDTNRYKLDAVCNRRISSKQTIKIVFFWINNFFISRIVCVVFRKITTLENLLPFFGDEIESQSRNGE